MNRGTSTRSGRVPLSSRGNVTNIDNGVNAKVTKKNGLGTILPSKRDSRPVSFAVAVPLPTTTTTTLLRQSSTTTTTSMASGSTGGGGVSAVSDNNRAFDSLSSDTLRQVIGTTNILNNIVGNDDFDAGVGIGGGTEKKGSSTKQPLGGSSMMNQQQLLHNNNDIPSGVVKPSSTATVISSLTATSSSSSEPITIIEHRKRPCGNGHTVHTYLRGKLLGKGGFAKVYKVTSLDTNKEYAVKVVPKANLVKSRARQKVGNMYTSQLLLQFFHSLTHRLSLSLSLHFYYTKMTAPNRNQDPSYNETCQYMRIQTFLRRHDQLLHPP